MRISPISFNNKQIQFKSKTNNANKQLLTDSHIVSPYPRRYLPNVYGGDFFGETYDSFTGLRDKSYLLKVISNKIEKSQKCNKDFTIAMFDMDNFKSINELLGYKTGDDFIKEISGSILEVASKNNIHAYRFGGEEFVIVFDNHSHEKKLEIINDVIQNISNNDFVQSKTHEYINNARKKLAEYTFLNNKIAELITLKSKMETLKDLEENFESHDAKNDPYFKKSIDDTDIKIKKLYSSLIEEKIETEENENINSWLQNLHEKQENNLEIVDSEIDELDEYLLSEYDKTFEIYQLKKWIYDFETNNGFSITGGTIIFKPEYLENKTPIDIVNEAGEVLKNGKNIKKGQNYFMVYAS